MTQPEKNTLESILVVEDHPVVLKVVCEILERGLPCASRRQRRASNSGGENYPGNDPPLAFRWDDAGYVGPGMRGTSTETSAGYARDADVGYIGGDMLFLNHGWHFIEKPFVSYELVARVNEVLHRVASGFDGREGNRGGQCRSDGQYRIRKH